jgi:P27 family predicted phage terminase small subunit
MLEGMGILGKPHTVALALLVDAIADFVDFTDRAGKVNPTVETLNGGVMQHPLVGMKNQAWSRVLQALREFGMTPSSLTNVRSTNDEEAKKPKGLDKYRPGPRLAV